MKAAVVQPRMMFGFDDSQGLFMGTFETMTACSEDVRFRGKTGSSRPTTKMTRLMLWTAPTTENEP
jgi:hypothetical protein